MMEGIGENTPPGTVPFPSQTLSYLLARSPRLLRPFVTAIEFRASHKPTSGLLCIVSIIVAFSLSYLGFPFPPTAA